MFNFLKKIVKKIFEEEQSSANDLKDDNGNIIQKSSIIYDRNHKRFLQLRDDCCAMVIYPDNNIEIIFTKLYDPEHQQITDNEETLMSLGVFMKQDGFAELIKDQFRKIAMENVNFLTKNNKGN